MSPLRAEARRWGWPLPAGAGALALAALLAAGLTPRWEAEAEAWRAEARTLRAARAPAAPPPEPRPAWPTAARSSDRLATLLEAAERDGVAVRRSQQRLEPVSGAPLQLLRVQQASQGRYADLRRHLAQALATDPALGLERLRLQRPDPQAATLEADLQWVLVQRSGAAPR